MAEKPDPKDFVLSNLSGETLVRNPGQIRGYDFVIDNLSQCVVYLLDYSAQITIDDCTDCTFYIGPVEGSVFFRDCANCRISVSVAQFRMKSCKDCDVYVFSNSDPSIEYCSGLRFGPLNLSYPRQDEHFRSAKLSLDVDHWSQVFDFNLADGAHWKILPPDEWSEHVKAVEGESNPINPVDRHVTYGGSITTDIQVGAQSQSEQLGEIQQFGFDTTQEQAEQMLEQGYAPMSDSTDPFGTPSDPFDAPQAADPFGAPADPFAAPSDPFSAPPAADPFGAPPAADPFDAPPVADPFGAPQGAPDASFMSEQDEEELERQRLRDAEYQERMQALYQREEAERTEKDSRRDAANGALKEWAEQRVKAIETRKKTNRDEEAVRAEQKTKGTTEKSWTRVVDMIDFKAQTDAKDRTRLRNVLMAKKSEG